MHIFSILTVKPIGIFSCLDEECVMPKANDESFTDKLHHLWNKKSEKYHRSKFSLGFILTHYAAEVEYSTEGWLEKNKDPLNENVTQLLVNSTESNIRHLFALEATQHLPNGKVAKKGLFRTAARRHKEELNHLMVQLNSTHPHFVRCIIPNNAKSPNKFDNLLVLDQLRCNGVLEGIRIARTGYPNRLFFSEFRQRYEVLVSGVPKGYIEGQKACSLILKKLCLDDTLYKVGLTKVFFKSGVLAELEERRETMIRELMTRFQSIARGYIQRQRIRKTLFASQATAIIKRNFEIYLGMRENPWWKMYVKMQPLLIVSRESGRSKAQDMAIRKLEESVQRVEKERDDIKTERKNIEVNLKTLQETLESERILASEKEEVFKRSQEREADLEDQLIGALDDLDRLELQCDELLIAKKKVDGQAQTWRHELENGALLIQHLEGERSKLKAHLELLEEEIARTQWDQAHKLEQHEKLSLELTQVRHLLEEREDEIRKLRELLAKSREELENADIALNGSKERVTELLSENKELREQLEDLYKTSSDYEELVCKKESELARVKSILAEKEAALSRDQRELKEMGDKLNTISLQLESSEKTLVSVNAKCAHLEKEEKEARHLLRIKNTDSAKDDESRKVLDRKVEDLTNRLTRHEKTADIERAHHVKELSAKISQIEKLQFQKHRLQSTVSELKGLASEKETLSRELKTAHDSARQAAALKSEVSALKKKISDCEAARQEGLQFIEKLKNRISDSGAHFNKLRTDFDQVLAEKALLSNQVSQLKKFIDDDLANKEYLILEKNKMSQELENTQQELSRVSFEYKKLSRELEQKGVHLKRMRTSFTDEAQTHRTKLNKEKVQMEAAEKKLRQELEDFKIKFITLEKQGGKMKQEIDDLKYDISVEKKATSAAELQKTSLQDQLTRLQIATRNDRKDKSEADLANRKLRSDLELLQRELSEKSSQLVALQKISKPTNARSRSWDESQTNELSKRLEEAEKKLKLTEESKAILEKQLREAKSSNRDLSASPIHRRSKLEEIRPNSVSSSPDANRQSLIATNGIMSAINNLYSGGMERGTVRSHNRSKSSLELNKENSEPLSVFDSIKSLNIRNKSIEEVEDLLTNYESSKRDLMSIYQETSKKLRDANDAIAAAENENSKLLRKLGQHPSQPDFEETDTEALNATISDLEMRLDAEVSMNQDLTGSLRLYKNRAEDYYSKLESAETVVLKASRAEAFAKAQWKEAEASLAKALEESKDQENKAIRLQSKIQQLEDKVEDSVIDLTHSREAQNRLSREIQDLKERRKQDSSAMESSLNTMRERYKNEIRSISEELETEKGKLNECQTENRHLQHELDMLKVNTNLDALDPSWSTFKTQLEDKIQELTKDNDKIVLSYQDSQRRVGSLLSQVRTLRTTMEEVRASRDQLQEEKGNLERRLNEVSEHLEELAQAPGFQSSFESEDELHQLKSSVRQKTQDHSVALERLKAMEDVKLDVQRQLQSERHRVEELAAERTMLDKENKDLHLKVVDLEAQLLGVKNSDSKFLARKVSLLEKQLENQAARYNEESRFLRSNDRAVKDLQAQLLQKDKTSAKLQEENVRNESKIKSLQETIENLQSLESAHSLASRRAEREARDLKETSLRLEKELEEWKNRYHAISSKRNSRLF